MTYKPKTKAWFIERIGKRIFRDPTECCPTCKNTAENGLIVSDEAHADYLYCTENDFASEGIFLDYRDVK